MDRIVLYTTDGNDTELRELYEDFLAEEEYTEDSISFEEWKEDELDEEWNDMLENIKYGGLNSKCVIEGTLGLWNGRKTIIPCVCDTLTEAIVKCVGEGLSIEISLENGSVKVLSSHHDGTNEFEIHILNKKGCNSVNGDLTKSAYHRKIKNLF